MKQRCDMKSHVNIGVKLMLGFNRKLVELENAGNTIKVGLVGAGQMGRGMVSQIEGMKGMQVVAVADLNIDHVTAAFLTAGKDNNEIVVTDDLKTAANGLQNEKVVATTLSSILTKLPTIDVIVDATGIPNVGADVALQAILNKKHIVMLNVET